MSTEGAAARELAALRAENAALRRALAERDAALGEAVANTGAAEREVCELKQHFEVVIARVAALEARHAAKPRRKPGRKPKTLVHVRTARAHHLAREMQLAGELTDEAATLVVRRLAVLNGHITVESVANIASDKEHKAAVKTMTARDREQLRDLVRLCAKWEDPNES